MISASALIHDSERLSFFDSWIVREGLEMHLLQSLTVKSDRVIPALSPHIV